MICSYLCLCHLICVCFIFIFIQLVFILYDISVSTMCFYRDYCVYHFFTITLLEQPMKVLERVLEKRIRCQVSIDNMQFGFMPGKGTTDAIFIMRQVQEK